MHQKLIDATLKANVKKTDLGHFYDPDHNRVCPFFFILD